MGLLAAPLIAPATTSRANLVPLSSSSSSTPGRALPMAPLPASNFRACYTALIRKHSCMAAASATCTHKILQLRNRCGGSTPPYSCPTSPGTPIQRYLASHRATACASQRCKLTTAYAVGPGPRDGPQEDRTAAGSRDSERQGRGASSGRQQEQPPQPQGPMPTAMDGLNWWVTKYCSYPRTSHLVECQGP